VDSLLLTRAKTVDSFFVGTVQQNWQN